MTRSKIQKSTAAKECCGQGKNIMHNGGASTKRPVNNNYKEGEMNGSDQDTKSIGKELSDGGNVSDVSTATTSIRPISIGDDKKQVSSQLATRIIGDEKRQVSSQLATRMPLQMAGGSEFQGKDDQRDSPSPKSSANGDEHSSCSSSFVRLPESDTENSNGECVKVSQFPVSGSSSSFEDMKGVPTSGKNSPQAATYVSGDKEASQSLEPKIGDSQTERNTASLETPQKSVGQELASVAQNNETENDILSIQSAASEGADKEQAAERAPLQAESRSWFEGKLDYLLSPESSPSVVSGSSSSINVSTGDGGVHDSNSGEYIKFEAIIEDTPAVDAGSPQDIQEEALRPLPTTSFNASNEPMNKESEVFMANIGALQQLKTLTFASKPSGISVDGGTVLPPVDGKKKKQTSTTGNVAQIDNCDDYDLSLLFLEENNKNSQPIIPPVPLVIQGSSAKGTSRTPDMNGRHISQKTKDSKCPIVAVSVLTVAGVAFVVAIAVHLEVLAVGIAVGACCLVAAAVMYHYRWPSSFIENSQIEKSSPGDDEKGPVAASV